MVVDDISVLTNRNLAALQGTLEKADVVHARAWDPVVLGLTWKNVVKSYTRVVGLPSHHCQCFNGFSTFSGQIFYEAHILINFLCTQNYNRFLSQMNKRGAQMAPAKKKSKSKHNIFLAGAQQWQQQIYINSEESKQLPFYFYDHCLWRYWAQTRKFGL